jgi:hypothetical protein
METRESLSAVIVARTFAEPFAATSGHIENTVEADLERGAMEMLSGADGRIEWVAVVLRTIS